jgi:hypothetical protein
MKLDIWAFLENLLRTFQVSLKSDKNNGYITWRLFTFMTSLWILFRMRNVLDKSCRENRNTHFSFITFFRKLCRFWYYVVEAERPQMVIWRIRVACWISKATLAQTHANASATTRKPLASPPPPHTYTHKRSRTHSNAHAEVCNTYCFFTATSVSWTRLSVTCRVHSAVRCYPHSLLGRMVQR